VNGVLPIRKVAPDKVALTSYYSKMFVTRSERTAFDYAQWIADKVTAIAIDANNNVITDVKMADVFDSKYTLPRLYTTLAMRISSFTAKEYTFYFDYGRRLETFGLDIMSTIEKHATAKVMLVPVARSTDAILLMNTAGELLKVSLTETDTGVTLLGSFESYFGIPTASRPVDVAEVGIFGKLIPLGIVLAHQLGLGNLLATLNTKHRREPKGAHLTLSESEFAIRFEDETLVVERTGVSELILGGFLRYHREIKRYSIYMFDKKEVYANVLDANGIGVRWVREFDMMFKLWVDHITRAILEEMREPTDLVLLFVRSAELLLTDQSPHQMDISFMRDKGYERFAGMVYFELIKAMRGYASRPATANAAVDLNPQAVWMSILQDQSVMPIEESNPIHALREKEEVIYSGSGGRTARSMTAEARVFHPSSKGTVSEATKDSGDVATVTYATADPCYNSLRGTTKRLTEDKGNASRIVSTSMLLAPGADRDDPKRVNFISVQNSQTTHCEGYTPVPCRTGYERVLAHRTDDLYAKTARVDGTVTALSDKVITVTYSDGEVANYEIGRRFGIWSGNVIPHDVTTDLKVGATVKAGDILIYNKQYFVRDTLDPSQVIFKTSLMARVVLWESVDTLEDSSAITTALAKRMTTLSTEVRYIKVAFDQEVRNLVSVKDNLEPESILCRLHNTSEGNTEIFDDQSLALLDLLSSSAPKAKMVGTVDKIEVLYAGELDDMSTTLRLLAERSDANIRRFNKQMGLRAVDGRVEIGYRVGGQPLESNTAIIKVYVTGDVAMGVGDKLVFSHQMKSIIGRVLTGENTTADGVLIDAIFAYDSISRRIVNSAELIGTTNSLLIHLGKQMVAAYESE